MSDSDRDPQQLRDLIGLAQDTAARLDEVSAAMKAARCHADGFGAGAAGEAAKALRGMAMRAAMMLPGDEAAAMLNTLTNRPGRWVELHPPGAGS